MLYYTVLVNAPQLWQSSHSPEHTSLAELILRLRDKSGLCFGMPLPAPTAPGGSAPFTPTALVIQIAPHHNGEVFLSKIAVNQNPSFFGFPFAGRTTKKSGAPGYPQRLPDPVVDITVYDAGGNVSLVKSAYGLNTVFYETKGEIRITISPDIREAIQPYSILHMQPGVGAVDYTMDIYNPGSPRYNALLASCKPIVGDGRIPQQPKGYKLKNGSASKLVSLPMRGPPGKRITPVGKNSITVE